VIPVTPPGDSRSRIRELLRRALTTPRFILCWLAIWLSAVLTVDYYDRIEGPAMNERIAQHHEMVTGYAPYAYRYRILTPYAAEGVARLLQQLPVVSARDTVPPLSYSQLAFTLAYCVLNFSALVTLLWSLGELIWRLFRYELALFGVAVSAMMVSFTFRDHYFHPWSFWEGAFFSLGLLLIHRKRYIQLSVVSLLGLLNRETSVFLLVAFLFTALPRELSRQGVRRALRSRELRFAVGNLAVWVVGFFILHSVIGYRPSTFFLETALRGNRAHVGYALILNALFVGLISPLVIAGIRRSPPLIRRSALMMPAYLGLLLVIGFWWEVRYWITLLPIVVPGLVAALANATPPKELEVTLPTPG
jgi:hypothetical protein